VDVVGELGARRALELNNRVDLFEKVRHGVVQLVGV